MLICCCNLLAVFVVVVVLSKDSLRGLYSGRCVARGGGGGGVKSKRKVLFAFKKLVGLDREKSMSPWAIWNALQLLEGSQLCQI